MEDELEGVPKLDRQERPVPVDVHGRPLVPQRVPELQPTPLQSSFIYLSIVVLICGVIAIGALELGTPMSSLWVKTYHQTGLSHQSSLSTTVWLPSLSDRV